MSDIFFEELGIRQPDYHLGAGGGTHAQQTAKIMVDEWKTGQKPKLWGGHAMLHSES